ncbi:lipid A deacylase LpxR family protein [Pistricoccus aurantiacus]|nr:lipid A deacylase LpxR family protein [Pistricoccus aurantiacus]
MVSQGCFTRRLTYCAFAFFMAMGLTTFALPAEAEVLSLKFENDLLTTGEDGHYTNGVELVWTFEPERTHWSQGFTRALPNALIEQADSVSYHFAHQMYTPNDIDQEALIENDRPYAGLMYGGVNFHDIDRYDSARRATHLNLDIGLVGPATEAEELQKSVHKLTGSDDPQGWDNQLRNEPIINLGLRRQWMNERSLAGLDFEHGPNLVGALGNLYTYAGAGYGLRWGSSLDDSYGIPAIAPSQGGRLYFTSRPGFDWFFFANLEGRFMAYNLLLDGNSFKTSHSVDRKEWVGDIQLGVAVTWDGWQLTYSGVARTKEFSEQNSADEFGSLVLSHAF